MQQYLTSIQELLTKAKFQEMWNICRDYYENRIISPIVEIRLGPEFMTPTCSEFCKLIMDKHYYLPQCYLSEQQLLEFGNALDKCDELDQRNLGVVIGMTVLGVIGFAGLGFTIFGALGGAILGALIGRLAGKHITKKKNLQLTEKDVYLMKMRSYIKWAQNKSQKYHYNLNLIRFIAEKILLESKIANHYKMCDQNGLLKGVIKRLGKLFKIPRFKNAIELSLLLAEEYVRILNLLNHKESVTQEQLREIKHFEDRRTDLEVCLVKSIDNVLKPMLFILREESILTPLKSRIESFMLKQEIMQIQQMYPDPQMSVWYIKMIVEQMKQPVRVENLVEYARNQNFRQLENIGIAFQNIKTNQDKQCLQKENQQIEIPVNVVQQELQQLQQQLEQQVEYCPLRNEQFVGQQENCQLINPFKLHLQNHPNKIFLQRLDPKSYQFDTPIQSFENIMIILEPEMKQSEQMEYPPHYTQEIIDKFHLFMKLHHESNDDWDLAVNTQNAVVYKTIKEGSDSVFIKGYGILRNTNVDQAVKCTVDLEIRKKWDKLLAGFKIVQTEYDDIDVIYYYVIPPVRLVTEREWLQRRIIRRNYPKEGQVCILFYSVDLPHFPTTKGKIRAETKISTMVFEEVAQGVKVSIISNNDIKGYIPKMIVNRASATGPVGWFSNLEKACHS